MVPVPVRFRVLMPVVMLMLMVVPVRVVVVMVIRVVVIVVIMVVMFVAMSVTVMMAVVFPGRLPVFPAFQLHIHAQALQAMRGNRRAPDPERLGQETPEIGFKGFQVRAQPRQRGENHVAAGTAHGSEAYKFHAFAFRVRRFFAGAARRLMRPAATPAPNPLSTLTTEIPAAHELSMASNAARPLKCMP